MRPLIKTQIEFLITCIESAAANVQSDASTVRPIHNLTQFPETAMAANIKIKILWNVISCSLIDGYICFSGTCCLHLQGFWAAFPIGLL
jgi:hypothetical protein